MHIIELTPLPNGAHRNQQGTRLPIPDGWAEIPPEIPIPDTFPFVGVETDGDGQITALTPGVVPEPEPITPMPTEADDTNALLVDHEYRLTLLELGVSKEVN